jgi:hypothetical protein
MSNRPPSKYDPADFIIPAQDSKGHSERIYASIQPGHSRQLDILLQSRRFPFRTRGDIIRWGVKEAIAKLEQMEDVPSVSAQVDVITNLMREEQFHAEYEATFDQMGGVIARHMANQAYGEVRRVIAQVRAAIDKMPDGYWKDRYMDTLDTRFERQLEAAEVMTGPPRQPRHRQKVAGRGHRTELQEDSQSAVARATGTNNRSAVRLIGGTDVDQDTNDE